MGNPVIAAVRRIGLSHTAFDDFSDSDWDDLMDSYGGIAKELPCCIGRALLVAGYEKAAIDELDKAYRQWRVSMAPARRA